MADSKEERAKRRRAKKAKEQKIVINLYINGVAYKYGISTNLQLFNQDVTDV